jgi:ectoine hydroxylase-related dioxygenase (phytanoyl-CoA dioxygenase family)
MGPTMPNRVLEQAAVADYRRDGIVFPIRVVDEAEAGRMLARLEGIEAAHGGRLPARINQKPHLLFPWLNALVRHPRIVDAVEDLLGPDLLCWSSQFFAKNGGDPSYVSWHQDATYWGLSSPDVVTAWVAFTPSTVESGCMRVVPGTQHRQVPHNDTFAATNLLSRGQEIAVDVDESRAVDVILRPGEMSLHHVLICHGSAPNRANHRRVGFAIRYIAASVYQTSGVRESATLVRGRDAQDHFDHELPPEADLHPDALARHARIIENQLKVLYAGAAQPGKLADVLEHPDRQRDDAAADSPPPRRHP